jgi:tetratricopeptide (TPR) repeat protein
MRMGRPARFLFGLDSETQRSIFLRDKDLLRFRDRIESHCFPCAPDIAGPKPPARIASALLIVAVALSVGAGMGPGTPATLAAEPAAAAATAADAVREADAAFETGDHTRALALYQDALAAEPDNLQALRRAGLLLGWAGRAKEGVPLLEKAVRLDPADRPTRLQLAREYSWSREFDQSLQAYDALIAEDPADVSTAVERARVLAWAGRLPESEESYRKILAAHPDSAEAKLGLAQTIGWQGRLDEAAGMYREELARSPSGARLGLARIDLLRDNAGAALHAARAELARDPRSVEAHAIEIAALALLRPSLGITAERTDDTDENRNDTVTATGSFHLGLLDLDVIAGWMGQEGRDAEIQRLARADLETAPAGAQRPEDPNALRELSSEWVGAAAGFAAGRTRATLAATVERLGAYGRPDPLDDRGTRTTVTGYAALRILTRQLTFRTTVAHEVPKWTAFITERDLRWDHAVVGVDGRLPWSLDWAAVTDWGRITGGSEENNRFMALGTLSRRFDLGGGWWLTPRYAARWLQYEHNLNDGYFDPQRYYSNVVGLAVGGILASGKLEWTLGASAGLERFRREDEDLAVCEVWDDIDEADAGACRSGADLGNPNGARAAFYLQSGEASDTNTIIGFLGRLVWNIREGTAVEVYAAHDESAAQTAAGFESNTYGAAARIRF